MPLRWEDLPKSLRDRVRAGDAVAAPEGAQARRQRPRAEAVPYECVACGEELLWSSSSGTSPNIEAHQAATGHAAYRMRLPATRVDNRGSGPVQ